MLALPRQEIQEMKLKWFQIRLLHKILATNIVLKEMGITQSVLCDFCNLERDSLQQCMWGCEHMKSFWNELERFICQNCENVKTSNAMNFLIIFLVPH